MQNNYQKIITSTISCIRRNHALEHATLHMLGQKLPGKSIAGYSDARGFWIVGDVETKLLAAAVEEAQNRLNRGEKALAVHPHCGTNFAVSGLLAGTAAWLAASGGGSLRKRLDRLPTVVTLVTLVLILAQPLGPVVQQRYMTDPALDGLQVVRIEAVRRGGLPAHRILTSDSILKPI
jgi:hypothetical protein